FLRASTVRDVKSAQAEAVYGSCPRTTLQALGCPSGLTPKPVMTRPSAEMAVALIKVQPGKGSPVPRHSKISFNGQIPQSTVQMNASPPAPPTITRPSADTPEGMVSPCCPGSVPKVCSPESTLHRNP